MAVTVTLTGTPASNQSISLTAGAASGGTGPYTYQFQRAPDLGHGNAGTFFNIGPNSATTTHTNAGLNTTVLYWYRVVATDSLGATGTSSSVPIRALLVPFPTLTTASITVYRYEADNAIGGDGDTVATITEIGGSGKNLTGTSVFMRPLSWPGGGGRPCWLFDQTVPSQANASTAADWKFLSDGTSWSAYVVFLPVTALPIGQTYASGTHMLFATTASSANTGILYEWIDTTSQYEIICAIERSSAGSPAVTLTTSGSSFIRKTAMVSSVTFDGTNLTIYNNGVQKGTVAKSFSLNNANPSNALRVGLGTGGANTSNQYIAAIVFVKGAVLNAADTNAVAAYLEAKYSPAGNPSWEPFMDSSGISAGGSLGVTSFTKYASNPIYQSSLISLSAHFDTYACRVFEPNTIAGVTTWAMYAGYYAKVPIQGTLYCTSTDGIAWTEPNLGQVTISGNTNNNLLYQGDAVNYWYFQGAGYDPYAASGKKFLASITNIANATQGGGFAYGSDDGLTSWSQLKVLNLTGTIAGGGGNSATGTVTLTAGVVTSVAVNAAGTNYNGSAGYMLVPAAFIAGGGAPAFKQAQVHVTLSGTTVGSFVVDQGGSAYTSTPTVTVCSITATGIGRVETHIILKLPDGHWITYGTNGADAGTNQRNVSQYIADTTDPVGPWSDWGQVHEFITPTANSSTQFGGGFWCYEHRGMYIGFMGRLNETSTVSTTFPNGSQFYDLWVSRDGFRWNQTAANWIPLGGSGGTGAWDSFFLYGVSLNTDGQANPTNWRCYYSGGVLGNIGPVPRTQQIGYGTVPYERIGYTTATTTGRAVYQPAATLSINCDSSGGGNSITAALLDAQGVVITGYDDAQSTVVNANTTRATIAWNGNSLPAQVARIRFTVTGTAKLYGYSLDPFVVSPPAYVPIGYGPHPQALRSMFQRGERPTTVIATAVTGGAGIMLSGILGSRIIGGAA